MDDLIRKSDALAACQGLDPEGDINNLPAVTVAVRPLRWEERTWDTTGPRFEAFDAVAMMYVFARDLVDASNEDAERTARILAALDLGATP